MANPMTRIFNGETNEFEDRPMTDEEFASFKAYQSEKEKEIEDRETKVAAKSALLDRLGITAEEAALLLS
jgi:hypothetical protein